MEIPTKEEYYRCTGWYAYGCDKILSNIKKINKIIPNKKFISSNDIIEYITYVDPKICPYMDTAINRVAKLLNTIEVSIVNGKFTTAATLSAFTSRHMLNYRERVHDVTALSEIVHHMKEDIYLTYLQYPETGGASYIFPKMPPVTFEHSSSDSSNDVELTKIITKLKPYLTVLEQYQMDVIRLLYQMSNALLIVIKKYIQ